MGGLAFRFFMAEELKFVLAMVDRISGPAKAATVALAALESQLRSVQSLLKDMPKLAIKIPKIGGEAGAKSGAMHGPVEQTKLATGPGRKEAVASAKYAERQQAIAAKAAERQASQSARAQIREQQRLAKAAEQLDKQRSSSLLRIHKDQEREAARSAVKQAKVFKIEEAKRVKSAKQAADAAKAFSASEAAATSEGLALIGEAAAATAAIALGLGAAFAYVAYSGASLAVHAAEAKNDTLDMLEAMLGSQEAAKSTYEQINAITKTVAISQESAETLARELTAAGVTNQAMLVGAVKAIGQTESVLKGAGSKIQGIIEKAAQTGKFEVNAKKLTGTGVQLSVLYQELATRTGVGVKQIEAQLKAGKVSAQTGIAALTAVLDKKFGAVAAKQAMDIGAQFQRFHDNISRLFEDVDTEPFLNALNEILSLVDQATPAGAALHDVLVAAFDGLFSAIARVEPYAKAFFKGLVIIGLQVAIALKPLLKQLGLTFGGDQQSNALKLAKAMSAVGQAIGWVISKVVALITNTTVWNTLGYALKGILAVIIGVAALAAITFGALVAIWSVGAAVLTALGTAILAAIGWLSEIGAKALEAGGNFVSGLIEGITNASGELYDTVKNIALGALDKFKSFFGISSPSKVMAKMGGHMTAGLSKGIRTGADSSAGAMVGAGARLGGGAAQGTQLALLRHMPQSLPGNDNAIRSRSEQPRIAQAASRTGSGLVVHLHVEDGAVRIAGVEGAAQLKEEFPSLFADWIERATLSNGTSGG